MPEDTRAGEPIRVMIVDDQEPVRVGIDLMIRRDKGMLVSLEAENGQQALDRLARAAKLGIALPDVVLMDVRMPVMDGIEATARIAGVYPRVSVLVLTTYDEDDYAFGALDAGASGFLLKDVRAVQLRDAIRAVAAGDAVLTPRITREMLKRGVRRAEQGSERERLRALFRRLTKREREICSLVADGLSNAEIAERLVIQPASAEAISAISASKSMFLIEDTISSPTYMSAGVVAKPGIARNTGEKNSATINITADVTAVRPVLPPAATPALDST